MNECGMLCCEGVYGREENAGQFGKEGEGWKGMEGKGRGMEGNKQIGRKGKFPRMLTHLILD